MSNKKDFIKYFIGLSIPVVIQQLLVNLLSITDTVMIGKISEDAISAVTVSNKFILIFNLMIFGLTNGIGLFISQYVGAQDNKNSIRVLRFGISCVCIVSILAMSVLFICPNVVITIFVSNENVIALTRTYNDVIRYSLIAYGLSQLLGVAYRVQGNSKLPMQTGFISFVANILLNYVLIFGKFGFPELGMYGAALATMLARYVEMLVLLYVSLKKNSYFYLFRKVGVLSHRVAKDILRKSIPLVCNESLWSIGMSLMFMNYCYVDESYIPALTVVDQISGLSYVVFAGFAAGVGVVIGNTLGANELEEAKRQSKLMVKIGIGIYGIAAIVIAFVSPIAPKLFSLGASSTMMATRLIIIQCACLWIMGYSETYYYILRAGGDTKSVLYMDGLFIILGPCLLSTIFSRIIPLNMYMLYFVVNGVNFIKAIIAKTRYNKGTWIRNLTIE